MIDDLIAFLRARLDEWEQRAREWERMEWPRADHDPGECDECDRARRRILNALDHPDFDDPAFVLADVAAKRRIVELYAEARQKAIDYREDYTLAGARPWSEQADHLEPVIRLLALPYADHPHYQEGWRP